VAVRSLSRASRAPWYLWVIGVLALLWNGLGIVLWSGTTFAPEQFLQGLPPSHRDYVTSLPGWSNLTWGVGVVSGTVGSLLLLLRQRWAVPAFGASLFGAIANTTVYVLHPAPEGFLNLPLTVFIIGLAALLLWFAWWMQRRGVL
jgi:hypothetical protein